MVTHIKLAPNLVDNDRRFGCLILHLKIYQSYFLYKNRLIKGQSRNEKSDVSLFASTSRVWNARAIR